MTKLEHLARAVGHLRRAHVELREASADLGTPALITSGRVLSDLMARELEALLEHERSTARQMARLQRKGGGS